MFRPPPSTASPARTRHLLRRAAFLGAGLLLLWLALQLAPSQPPPPDALSESTGADAGVAVRSRPAPPRLFSTGTVLACVLLAGGAGLAFFLRRRSREESPDAFSMTSLGQMSLAPGQHLRLVRCGEAVLLLGVTSGQITLLKEYPPDAFERDAASSSPSAVTSAPFAHLLRQHVQTAPGIKQQEAA